MYEYESDDIITVEELMEILRIGKTAAYKLLNDGAVKAFRVGHVWKIPKALLNDFILQSAINKICYIQ